MPIPRRLVPLALLALLPLPVQAGPDTKTYQIPYKLTTPKHIAVRAKINGKGPFNLILDTGAPALILATKAAKQAGIRPDANSWATLDKLELEGGLKMPPVKARIETPFQLEGMNGMGLAGMEIHGLLGYQALARYRMEIDFTKDKMTWVELDFAPAGPLGLGMKGGGQGDLAVLGSVMKMLGGFLGRKSVPEVTLRGFHGMSLVDAGEYPKVERVLEKGPAGGAGLQAGDVVLKVQDRTVSSVADVLRFANRVPPGSKITLTVQRNGETKQITFTTQAGI